MMNVAWSCLEVNVMNDGGYVKVFLTYTHTHNEWINGAIENVMNESLLKGFINNTLMNENEGFWGGHFSWVEM